MKPNAVAAAILLALSAGTALAWPGHNYEEWKQLSTWQPPTLPSRQAGQREPVPLLGAGPGESGPIADPAQWKLRREQLSKLIAAMLGEPSPITPATQAVQVIGEAKLADHVRRHIRIPAGADDWIPAYVLIPTSPASGKRPAMLVLHQTVNQGKDEPCGINGSPDLDFALELVRRGYVCIAPDVIGFGERIPAGTPPYTDNIKFFQKHPSWSVMGKMNWDASRCLDYLTSLPEVDAARIGCIGHSHGAYGGLFATAFDERIKAVVASCGFNTFRADPRPDRWSHLTPLIPQVGTYLPAVEAIPFDWHEVCALVAPRGLFIWYATQDDIFPNCAALKPIGQDVGSVYSLLKADQNLVWEGFDGGHSFPQAARERAYAWLDAQLGVERPASEPATSSAPCCALLGAETVVAGVAMAAAASRPARPSSNKKASVFYTTQMREAALANAARDPVARKTVEAVIKDAADWLAMSDDQLWEAMFGATLPRTWMVWSNGHCPSCKGEVPMYNWVIDPIRVPWKVACPHCKELFPKNDFAAFYRSGLDEHGVFDPAKADRTLLFNAEHPAANDPLHAFGVDDGTGYVEGEKRWRFIGGYLVYGQWKKRIVEGCVRLANAYTVTGDTRYSRKAGILLDRIADLYPTFDFFEQGWNYERHHYTNGYVSVWHDAAYENRMLALAYDQAFDGMKGDPQLVAFLAEKAKRYQPANPKRSFADIQHNIEDRILLDQIRNIKKITSNYPQADLTVIISRAVIDWPAKRDEITAMIDPVIAKTTAVDGVTGEKGMCGYTALGPQDLALFLERFARIDPQWFADTWKRHPALAATWRFHLDCWTDMRHYPLTGDTGWFGWHPDVYYGARLQRPMEPSQYGMRDPELSPSMFSFMHRLWTLTGDPGYMQAGWNANKAKADGLPYDLFAGRPDAIRDEFSRVIEKHGPRIQRGDVHFPNWRLAIMRGGAADSPRSAWLDYDAGGPHGHADGLNIGLYAHGLDLMPEFGYPPVQYGGWGSPRAVWYTTTAAHNTVLVNNGGQTGAGGTATMWFAGKGLDAVRASAPGLYGISRYERTLVAVDEGPKDVLLLDVFRVAGGAEHTRYMHSSFAKATPSGLDLKSVTINPGAYQMRDFREDAAPEPGWSVDFAIEDRYTVLPKGSNLHLRYTDLTREATGGLCEAWIVAGIFNTSNEAWIPRVYTRRRGAADKPLASTFVGLIEPYEGKPLTSRIQQVAIESREGREDVATEITLEGGRQVLIVAADSPPVPATTSAPAAGPGPVRVPAWEVELDGELGVVRRDSQGRLESFAVFGKSLRAGDLTIDNPGAGAAEAGYVGAELKVITGDATKVRLIRRAINPSR